MTTDRPDDARRTLSTKLTKAWKAVQKGIRQSIQLAKQFGDVLDEASKDRTLALANDTALFAWVRTTLGIELNDRSLSRWLRIARNWEQVEAKIEEHMQKSGTYTLTINQVLSEIRGHTRTPPDKAQAAERKLKLKVKHANKQTTAITKKAATRLTPVQRLQSIVLSLKRIADKDSFEDSEKPAIVQYLNECSANCDAIQQKYFA
jgi:uncharacterized membrane protein YidH (DUF202 family)